MAWRSIVISKPARLRRLNFSLLIAQEQVAEIPFEDIAVIVLNHRQITLTHAVLSACADYGVALYSTGEDYQPNGVFLPFLSHYRAARILNRQLSISKSHIKRAWAKIIQCKIQNQARCLDLYQRDGGDYLRELVKKVRSGDVDNIEGEAAAFYFRHLFDNGFTRKSMNKINSALNYGYSIFRGAIARALVVHGFLPSLGLFHKNEKNAFNLADDVIETFRPVVDLYVAKNLSVCDSNINLLPCEKVGLIALLNVEMEVLQGKVSALSAIEYMVESLSRLYEYGDLNLNLPQLIGLSQNLLEY